MEQNGANLPARFNSAAVSVEDLVLASDEVHRLPPEHISGQDIEWPLLGNAYVRDGPEADSRAGPLSANSCHSYGRICLKSVLLK